MMFSQHGSFQRQSGVALLIGLILLLVMSIIGLSAIRGTTQQERMAAANQQQTQTFQAAEAAIRVVMAELRGDAGVETPPDDGGMQMLVKAINNGKSPPDSQIPKREAVFDDDAKLEATAAVTWTGTGVAAGGSIGKFSFYQFQVDSSAKQSGTNAQAQNRQGIGYIGPSENN